MRDTGDCRYCDCCGDLNNMTFVNHGIAGGLIHWFLGWWLWRKIMFVLIGGASLGMSMDTMFQVALFISGFVIGLLPDILSLNPVWHDPVHFGEVNKYLRWIPAWGYHTWLDSFCRPYSERKVLKKTLEIVHWIIYVLFGLTWYILWRLK